MNKSTLLTYLPWLLAVFIAVVFLQSLFFKFSNSFETQHIFGTIGAWLGDRGVPAPLAEGFARYGGYSVGTLELIASLLLLWRRTQVGGAVIAWLVISGALFFHLFTPLGVSVVINEMGERDGGQLFSLAVAVWFCALGLFYLRRDELKHIVGMAGLGHQKTMQSAGGQ